MSSFWYIHRLAHKSAKAHNDTRNPNSMGQWILAQMMRIMGMVMMSPHIRFLISLFTAVAGVSLMISGKFRSVFSAVSVLL